MCINGTKTGQKEEAKLMSTAALQGKKTQKTQNPDRWRLDLRAGLEAQLLRLLSEANGDTYDDICRYSIECAEELLAGWKPPRSKSPSDQAKDRKYAAKKEGVRAVRGLLWKEFATTESDESVWLTPLGWKAAEELKTDQQKVALV